MLLAAIMYHPLHVLELGMLLGIPDKTSINVDNVKIIVKMCGSFLTVQDNRIYIIHQSAKDYLRRNAITLLFPSSPENIHRNIFL